MASQTFGGSAIRAALEACGCCGGGSSSSSTTSVSSSSPSSSSPSSTTTTTSVPTIAVDCCEDEIPETLFASVIIDCISYDGVIPIVFNGTDTWTGRVTLECVGRDRLVIASISCIEPGVWAFNLTMTGEIDEICNLTWSAIVDPTCFPFSGGFDSLTGFGASCDCCEGSDAVSFNVSP